MEFLMYCRNEQSGIILKPCTFKCTCIWVYMSVYKCVWLCIPHNIVFLQNSSLNIIAFDKERLHNAVAFENFGPFIHTNLPPAPEKNSRGEIIQGEWRNFHWPRALFLAGVEFHVLLRVLVWFLVEVDLLVAFWCAFLSKYGLCFLVYFICSRTRSPTVGFRMLTVETAASDCICWFSSSRDREGQFYPVEYCLESVEEYSEARGNKSEPEPRNGNVNTVYLFISGTDFVYNERVRDYKCLLIFEFPAQNVFVKNILLQISFCA